MVEIERILVVENGKRCAESAFPSRSCLGNRRDENGLGSGNERQSMTVAEAVQLLRFRSLFPVVKRRALIMKSSRWLGSQIPNWWPNQDTQGYFRSVGR